MQANSGNGLYIRKGHSGAFKTTETITASTNTAWMPVTSITDAAALKDTTSFAGKFGTLKGISTDTTKLEYTAITGAAETGTDAYTAAVTGDDATNGVYYNFQIDYMITAGKTLKVTATDVKAQKDSKDVTDAPTIAQAARVGIIAATSYTKGTGNEADTVTYATSGKEYTIAEPATTDYNLEELKALGYTGNSEYKTGLTRLDSTGATFKNTTALDTTTDGAFAYGSLNIYV